MLVVPDRGPQRVPGGHPVDGPPHLPAVRRISAPGLRVAGAAELDDAARRILHDLPAPDEVGVPEADLPPRREPEELPGRVFLEVGPLDVQLARERHLARSGAGVLRIVDRLELLGPVRGVVLDDHLQRTQHRQHPRSGPVEFLPDGVFELRRLHDAVRLGDADPVAEGADGGRRVAAAPHAAQRRHAGIVPAPDVPPLDQLQQPALAEHRVREVEPGELDLPRRVLDVERPQVPVVERPVVLELQRAERMRDPLERVRQRVREVVGRIDDPGVGLPVVGTATDPVDGRVAQVHVGRRHVDLRPQRPRAVGELARPHPREQVQVLLHRPAAVRAVAPRLVPPSAVAAHLVPRQVVDVGQPLADQRHRALVQPLEVVRGVVRTVLPVEAEPADVPLDRAHELQILGLRVRVVHAQVAEPAELLRDAEVQADRLGVADVQIAVRLGRKPGADPPPPPPGGPVGGDDLADEVEAGRIGSGSGHAISREVLLTHSTSSRPSVKSAAGMAAVFSMAFFTISSSMEATPPAAACCRTRAALESNSLGC